MSVFGEITRRSDGKEIRTEDDRTGLINEFFSNQKQVKSCTIVEGHPNWLVDVDGSVHIWKDDILPDGTLEFFKLNKVTGNLVCHTPRIKPQLVPNNLLGEIVFDLESYDNLPDDASATISDSVPEYSGVTSQDVPEEETYLDFLSKAPDKNTIEKTIRSLLVDAEVEMTIKDLENILNQAHEQRQIKYWLELKISKKRTPNRNMVDIIVKDSNDKEYPVQFDAVWKAVYLTFLYWNEPIALLDFCEVSAKPNKCFKEYIYKLLYNRKAENPFTYHGIDGNPEELEDAVKALRQCLSKINKRLVDSLPNDRAARLFAISSRDGNGKYTIEASNDDIRQSIKRGFRIDLKY